MGKKKRNHPVMPKHRLTEEQARTILRNRAAYTLEEFERARATVIRINKRRGLSSKGGVARAAKLSPKRRREIARTGAEKMHANKKKRTALKDSIRAAAATALRQIDEEFKRAQDEARSA